MGLSEVDRGPECAARMELREQSIREEARRVRALELEVAQERFRRVQEWLTANRSDIAPGATGHGGLIADDDSFSLPELEGYGAHGNAIRVALEGLNEIGELWWCDPEERPTLMQRFAFYTKVGNTSAAFALQYDAATPAVETH